MSATTRIIKLKLLTQVALVKVETSARTLAEFKAEPSVLELGIDWSGAKLIDRASKATFDLDEAVLPAIDSLMFVTPTKTKSGGCDYSHKECLEIIKVYKNGGNAVPFNASRTSTTALNKFIDDCIDYPDLLLYDVNEDGDTFLESSSNNNKYKKDVDSILEGECGCGKDDTEDSMKTIIINLIKKFWIEESNVVELVDETTLEDIDSEAKLLEGRV